MRKLKVYLDTSVISHLMQEDVPEKMADTLQLWELFREGVYDVYLSTVTLEFPPTTICAACWDMKK